MRPIPRRLRKWLLRAAVASGVLLLLLVAVYAARRPLFEQRLIDRVQAYGSELLGGSLQVESIGGNWLTGIRLRGISLQGGEVVADISGGTADVDFDLWQLWHGDLTGLQRIEVRAAELVVVIPQQATQQAVPEPASGEMIEPGSFAAALSGGLQIDVTDFELRGAGDSALRGPLRLSAAARAKHAELLADLQAPGISAQIALEKSGQLRVRVVADAAEQIARLFTVVPAGTRGKVQLTATVRLAPEFQLALTGSVTDAAAAGHAIDELGWQASLQGGQLAVQKLWGRTAEASFDCRDLRVDISDPAGGSGSVQLTFDGLRPYLELLPADLAQLADLTGSLNATLGDGALHIEPSVFELPGIRVQITAATLPLVGGLLAFDGAAGDRLDGATCSFVAEIQDPPDNFLAADLPVRPVSGTLRGTVHANEGAWRVDVDTDIGLLDRDGRSGQLSGRVTMVLGDTIELQPQLRVSGALLRGAPALSVAGRATIGSRIDLDAVSLRLDDGGSLVVRGTLADPVDFGQSLQGSTLEVRAERFRLQPICALLGLPEWSVGTLDGSVQLSEQATAKAELRVEFSELPGLGAAVATLAVDATSAGLDLRDLLVSTAALELRASGELAGLTLPQLLAAPERILRAELSGTARVQAEHLDRLALPSDTAVAQGAIDADFVFAGTLASPVVEVRLQGGDAQVVAFGMRFQRPTGKLTVNDRSLTIEEFAVQIDAAKVQLAGSIQRSAESVRGDFTAMIAGLGAGTQPLAVQLAVVADGQRLAIERLHASNPVVEVDASAVIVAASLDDLLGQPEQLLEHQLQASVRIVAADIGLIESLQHGMSGGVTAALAIGGTVREPIPTVDLHFEGMSVRIPGGPRIDDLRGSMRIRDNHLESDGVTATVAGGTLAASVSYRGSGPLLLAKKAWGEGELDLRLDGKDVLLRRKDGVKIRSDLDLTATGKLDHIDLKGTVRMHSSKIVGRIPFFAFGQAGGAAVHSGMVLEGPDLGEGVAVYLDVSVESSEPIKIDTNVITGGVMAGLTVRGTLRAPRLEGTVAMPSGKIILPGCQFRASNALMQFNRDDPFFPTLAVNATGRRHGYDIRMIVSGRYDKPEIQLSSTPPLAAEQLAVLVTTGARPEALLGGRALGAVLGSYLAEELADNLFGSESTEAKEGFVSRFFVESGTEISADGTESVVVQFRMFDNVYLEGERDIYEDVNFGIVYRIRFK